LNCLPSVSTSINIIQCGCEIFTLTDDSSLHFLELSSVVCRLMNRFSLSSSKQRRRTEFGSISILKTTAQISLALSCFTTLYCHSIDYYQLRISSPCRRLQVEEIVPRAINLESSKIIRNTCDSCKSTISISFLSRNIFNTPSSCQF
jgi:hypothetical protein